MTIDNNSDNYSDFDTEDLPEDSDLEMEFDINVEEKIGKLVFFHGDTLHKVTKNKIKKDRFLISFNFEKIKFWSPLAK